MKRIVFLFLAAVFTASYAQAQIKIGARAGFNFTNLSKEVSGFTPEGTPNGKVLLGMQFGLLVEYAFTEELSAQSGLLFSAQGCRYKYSMKYKGYDADYKETARLNYLQIPINAQYKVDLGDKKLLLHAGPYIGVGINGISKWELKYDGKSDSSEDEILGPNDDEPIKEGDFGFGIGVGLQFDNIRYGLEYKRGLTNISRVESSTIKNYGFALTVTYMFGKK